MRENNCDIKVQKIHAQAYAGKLRVKGHKFQLTVSLLDLPMCLPLSSAWSVLASLVRKICLVYLNDILIIGKTFEDNLEYVARVLDRLQEAGLKLKPTFYWNRFSI